MTAWHDRGAELADAESRIVSAFGDVATEWSFERREQLWARVSTAINRGLAEQTIPRRGHWTRLSDCKAVFQLPSGILHRRA